MEVTGMIVGFVGSEPPDGWLLCDGSDVPNGDSFNALRKMIGDKLPDLKGAWSLTTGTSWTHTRSTQHGTDEQHGTSTADPGFGGRLSDDNSGEMWNKGQSEGGGRSHGVTDTRSYGVSWSSKKQPSQPVINFIIKV